jgi:MinD-like ATPase involved in chromosome partitioning or flagellar assembly
MLVACWSAKGGAGTTVVAATLAVLFARRSPHGALIADLAGDVPAALGLTDAAGPGIADWLAAGPDVPTDALGRLEHPAGEGLAVLPRGLGTLDDQRAEVLSALLASDDRPVIADCGTSPTGVALTVAAEATRSILVTRPCFLSLRRAMATPLRPSEVVLLSEPGRALTRADVEDCVGAPVVTEVAVDPHVARAVDAGLLATRLPRTLAKELGRAA